MRLRLLFLIFALSLTPATKVNAVEDQNDTFSFVVLGHVRGRDNGKIGMLLEELLADIDKLKPDLIFLTGDMIWGDYLSTNVDGELIKKDWERLDSALAQFGVPIYRTPGNHDFNDPVTRDIYFSRYGELPQVVTFRNSRFILLNSSYVPEGDDPLTLEQRHKYIRTKRLASKQIDFIREEFSQDKPSEHVFIFMHHLLWWSENAAWWRDVHPLLVGKNVRAVFGGDLGPMKFSHMERDGIGYIQSSMDALPSVKLRRDLMSCNLLSQQFDNYLYVTVDGSDFTIDVNNIGEMSHGKFTPQQWEAVNGYAQTTRFTRIWKIIGKPDRLTALGILILASFAIGVLVTFIWHRRKKD